MPAKINGITGIDVASLPYLVGQVCFFGQLTPPAGFVKCNGDALSRTTYAKLFAAIGTTYGAGNGTTTFNVPELRGEFLRVLDDGRGVDVARAVGTAQAATGISSFAASSASIPVDNEDGTLTLGTLSSFSVAASNKSAVYNKTRPRNVALPAYIFAGV